MVLKGINWVHNDKIGSNDLEIESIGYTMITLGQMILKRVSWLHNNKIGSHNGLERSQLDTQ